jgi:taurine dioxygenase
MATATMERVEAGEKPFARKLHPHIGAEILNVDLSRPLDDATLATIKRAWAESTVLVFRGQNLSPDDQKRFAAHFGPLAERLTPPKGAKIGDIPVWNDLMMISNEVDEKGKALGALGQGEMWFHTDKCYVPRPHRATFLYGMRVPTEGGHTRFSSVCAAYERLPDDMKERLDGRTVMQGHQYGAGRRIDVSVDLATIHHHRQPLIVRNPDSGRKGIYVSSQNTMWIEGMEPAESEKLLNELFAIVEADDLIYEHVWRAGDLVMWDNLSCLHARTDWPKDQVRQLRRCTVVGDPLR